MQATTKYDDSTWTLVRVFLPMLLLSTLVAGVLLYTSYANRHAALESELTVVSREVEEAISAPLEQVYALRALVVGDPDANITELGQTILTNGEVRNALLAPDCVVSSVWPLEGNEAVLGLDLLSDQNASHADALLASTTPIPVISGPFELVQGGAAISSRLGVFLPDTSTKGGSRLWGIVSVTIDYPIALKNSKLDKLEAEGYQYQLARTNNNDISTVQSDEWFDNTDVAHHHFNVVGLEFVLKAYPTKGWLSPQLVMLSALSTIVAASLGTLIFVLAHNWAQGMRRKAALDPLTGLLNREGWNAQLAEALEADHGHGDLYVLVDIDNFKKVNDTMGHQKGDEVLRSIAAALKDNLRERDLVCRLGGDEFCALVRFKEDPSSDTVKRICEQLRTALNFNTFLDGSPVTVSVGGTIVHGSDSSADLYTRADKLLYRAKGEGRDRVALDV